MTTTDEATVEVTSTSTTTVDNGGGSNGGSNGGSTGSNGGGSSSNPAPGTLPWAKRLVDELYLEVLGRTADPAGESYWINQVMGAGQGPVDIARSLLASDEYRQNFVESLYWQYLNRGGDPAGVASWVNAMGDGMTDETVRLAFLGSPEFWSNSGGNADGYVTALYQTVLQRQPDASGEAYWAGRLDAGAARASVAAALIDSPEVLQHRVAGYYLTYLARNASAGELAYWAGQLAAGVRDETVIDGFVGSTEYLSRI